MPSFETNESSGQTRDVNINIRAKRRQRDLIDQAAALLGKSRSDFMLESACREAEDVLLDQRVFTLDAEAYEKFIALRDAPPPQRQSQAAQINDNPSSVGAVICLIHKNGVRRKR